MLEIIFAGLFCYGELFNFFSLTFACSICLQAKVGFDQFYRTVTWNLVRSAKRPALLFILVLLLETKPAKNIAFVIEPADKKMNPTTVCMLALTPYKARLHLRMGGAFFITFFVFDGNSSLGCIYG